MRKRQAKKLARCDVCGVGRVLAYQRGTYSCGKAAMLFFFFECNTCYYTWNSRELKFVAKYGVRK